MSTSLIFAVIGCLVGLVSVSLAVLGSLWRFFGIIEIIRRNSALQEAAINHQKQRMEEVWQRMREITEDCEKSNSAVYERLICMEQFLARNSDYIKRKEI